MHLSRLSLTDFRSYADAVVAPGPGLVIVTGENGAGKTNLLEAISLFSPGRGLRGAALRDMARQDGPGGFAVAARLAGDQSPSDRSSRAQSRGAGTDSSRAPLDFPRDEQALESQAQPLPSREESSVDLGTGTTPSAPDRRQVRINAAPASANALGEWLSVLWLTPAMDRLFQEGASGRRRFLDRLALALHPAHAGHSTRYEAAMRARNKLLAEERPDAAWLTALEARMAEHGAEIEAARAATVSALAERLAAAPEGPFARAGLTLDPGWESGDLAEALARGRVRDAAAGRTLAGPHRADLDVTHLGKNQPATLCSTGEQKALLIGLILAHADLVAEHAGRRPILLLDEIAAHLDPGRRAALFDRLSDAGGQVWMTGTEPSLFAAVADATWLGVEHGRIHA